MFPYRLPFFPGTPNEFKTVGPYATTWDTIDFPNQQYKCYFSQRITFALLAALQAVNMFWFFLIGRILYRILFKGVQKDERSDDEDEVEDEREREKEKLQKHQINGSAVKPQLAVNGKPIGGQENGHVDATALEVEDRKATLRKR